MFFFIPLIMPTGIRMECSPIFRVGNFCLIKNEQIIEWFFLECHCYEPRPLPSYCSLATTINPSLFSFSNNFQISEFVELVFE